MVTISVASRMDYDTTALPWFLVPRWNTSAWGEYITHFGPQGVLDHKARPGLLRSGAIFFFEWVE